MKICLVNNLYYPYERGGAERVVAMSVAGLKKAGHESFVICSGVRWRLEKGSGPAGEKVYYLPAYNFCSYQNLNRLPLLGRLFWRGLDIINVFTLSAFKKVIKKERPSVVITHNLTGLSLLFPRWLARENIRHAHYLHDIQLLHPSGLLLYGQEKSLDAWPAKFYQSLARRFFAGAPLALSPSHWLLKMHMKRGFFSSSQALVLPNPIAGAPIASRRSTGADPEFLYVGQITRPKGVLLLFGAFSDYLAGGGRGHLRIVGAGDLDFAPWRKKFGERLICVGKKNSRQVLAAMSAADVLIVPSLCYENSPTVIHEAMLAGLPVIAADLGGIPELLKGSGLLFTPGSQKDLSRQMLWAASHPQQTSELGARLAGLADSHKLENYIQRLSAILENIR